MQAIVQKHKDLTAQCDSVYKQMSNFNTCITNKIPILHWQIKELNNAALTHASICTISIKEKSY